MNRKKFLKKTLFSTLIGATAVQNLNATAQQTESTYDKLKQQIGFNHLHNKNINTMNTVIHKANTRGAADLGWLNSHHTFSFANYHNPQRMHFGALRVLNDDKVQAGKGFGTHPHDNMEIVSIPLKGDLEHKDSMGNVAVIKEGDVQVLSAGKGITHSEYNKNKNKDVEFLQIWMFPNKKNVSPRYDQVSYKELSQKNTFTQILSPDKNDQGVWVHQDAWFHIGDFDKGHQQTYPIKKEGNGVYAFVLSGEIALEDQKLSKRDGMGIWNTQSISMKAIAPTRVLFMEVPMKF